MGKLKFSIIIFILIRTLGCENKDTNFIGTWKNCKNGTYTEWKITKNEILIFGLLKNDIAILESKTFNNYILLKGLNVSLANDTIFITKKEKSILIKSGMRKQTNELFKIEHIDETYNKNSKNWKSKMIMEFNIRKTANCIGSKKNKKLILDIEKDNKNELEFPIK